MLLIQLLGSASLIAHGNGNASFFITSTSESRAPNEVLYLTSSASRGEGALRGWEFDEDKRNKLHLYPVPDKEDVYYIVGPSESRKPGYMGYLGDNGKSLTWPFDPMKEDEMAQWRFVPSGLSSDGPSYFIVSTATSRYPDEMLYIDSPSLGSGGPVSVWKFDETDKRCLWRLIPAPPSPPLPSAAEIAAKHDADTRNGWIIFGCIFLGCCLCGACSGGSKRRRQRTRARAGRVRQIARDLSSGHIAVGRPVPATEVAGMSGVTVVDGVAVDAGASTV